MKTVLLEKMPKILESNMNNHEEHNDCETQSEQIYKIKTKGIIIKGKCEWYEHREKLYLNLEKGRAI